MTNERTLERIREADPVPSATDFPHGAWSSRALLDAIDERSTSMTDLKTAPTGAPERKSRWQGPVIALAVAAVILVVVGIAGLVLRNDADIAPVDTPTTTTAGPAIDASATPMEVVDAYLAAVGTGDYPAYEALLDPDQIELFAGLNGTRRSARYQAATGMVVTHDCAAEGATVTCTSTRRSGLAPEHVYPPFAMTATVENGLITELAFSADYAWADNADADETEAYRLWVQANRDDVYDTLFGPLSEIVVDIPSAVALHQEVIAEYLAATG